jgi:hypothetical protein
LAHLDDLELLVEAERRMRDNPVFIPLDDAMRSLGFDPKDFEDDDEIKDEITSEAA